MKISVIEQNVQTIESVYTFKVLKSTKKSRQCGSNLWLYPKARTLTIDNNENQHLKVVLMTNNIFERGLVICMYVH